MTKPKKPRAAGVPPAGPRRTISDAEFFPTPPWATRALLRHVLGRLGVELHKRTAWDPAAGEGHMVHALREEFATVHATDLHGYDFAEVGEAGPVDFLTLEALPFGAPSVDWIITNPPYGQGRAMAFAHKALELSAEGVALFCRASWAESAGRYEGLFRDNPPAIEAVFAERVPIVAGGWDPLGDTMTPYAWFVWMRSPLLEWCGLGDRMTRKVWIPPGLRDRLTTLADGELAKDVRLAWVPR